jgi:hypothetical protein
MRHLKYFRTLSEGMGQEETIYADSWTPTENPEGDYDVKWTSPDGEEKMAVFADTGGPVMDEGEVGYSLFETVPGTSSDGKEYLGEVLYKELGGDGSNEFQIVSILIKDK